MTRPLKCLLCLIALFALGMAGCSRRYRPMVTGKPPLTLPKAFSSSGAIEAPERWWTAFDSTELTRAVDTALAGNLDLKAAWSRLDQLAAVSRQARAARRPQAQLMTGANRFRQVFLLGAAFGGGGPPNPIYRSQFDISLGTSYEVDLWGKLRDSVRAARFDAQATKADLEATAIILTSNLVEAWFWVAEQGAQLALLEEQVKVNQTFLELTELRFGQGQASALDVYQQRQHLAATRAEIPRAHMLRDVHRHRLAVLMGKAPRELPHEPGAWLPELPSLPDTGLPVAILLKRPDVWAAQLRLFAADRRVAIAVKDRFPNLRLSADTGFSGAKVASAIDSWVWSLGASVLSPIFDGGRRKTEIRRRKAFVQEQLHRYGQAIIRALQEVEDALTRESRQREYKAALEEQLHLANATLKEAKNRYLNGLTSYLNVLTALQGQQRLQRQHLYAWRELLSYRVALHRALGGSWAAAMNRSGQKSKTVIHGKKSVVKP